MWIAYANSLGLGLAMDARGIIPRDPRIRQVTAQNLGLILSTDYWWPSSVDRLYRPVTTASFLFNYAVLGGGENAAGYHWLNLLLHLGNVWLVYALAGRLLRSRWAAFAAAAVWAVHPIGTEAVANIAGRADLLASMAVLGGLLLYARIRTESGRRFGLGCAALFTIATLGVLSKENAAVLAGLMFLWDIVVPLPRQNSGWMHRAWAYAAALAGLCVLLLARSAVFAASPWPEVPFVDNPIRAAGFWAGRLTAVKVIGLDLWLLVWPLHLSSDRAFNAIALATASDPAFWSALLAMAAILVTVILRRRRDPPMYWAAGFFAIALLPTSNLLFPIGSIMAERFLYLPAVAFALALAALAERIANRRLASLLVGLAVILCAARTWARNADWSDDLALDTADVSSAPASFRVHEALAFQLYEKDARGNIDRAISEGETAWNILRVLPPEKIYQQTPARLGLYYLTKGDLSGDPSSASAHAWYEKALAVLARARQSSRAGEKVYDRSQLAHGKPLTTRVAFQPLYFILAAAYQRLGRYPEAVESALYGRNLDPTRADGYSALAAAYRAMGDSRRAAAALDELASVLGLTPAVAAELREAYGPSSCALAGTGEGTRLNLACPLLRSDMCRAWADLVQAFGEARIPKPAAYFASAAVQNGCPALP